MHASDRAVRQLAEILRYIAVTSPMVLLVDGRGRCLASTVAEDDAAMDRVALAVSACELSPAGTGLLFADVANGVPANFELCAVRGDVVLAVALPDPSARFAQRERCTRALPLLRKIVRPARGAGPAGAPPSSDGGSGAPVSPDLAWGTPRRPR